VPRLYAPPYYFLTSGYSLNRVHVRITSYNPTDKRTDRQTDRLADDLPRQYRALRSIARLKLVGAYAWGPTFSWVHCQHVEQTSSAPAIFVTAQKCPCHGTFDLDLGLEHTLDAGLPGDHRVQVWWRCGHIACDGAGNNSADRQTDRHDLPRAILPEPS